MNKFKVTILVLTICLASTAFATGGKQGPPTQSSESTVLEMILDVLGL